MEEHRTTHLRRSTLALVTSVSLLALAPVPALANPEPDVQATKAKKAKKSDKITFYAGLERPEDKAIKTLRKVADPDSGEYRDFFTRNQVKKQYGAHSGAIKALRTSAEKHNLSVDIDGTGVFAAIKGKAGNFEKWLGKPVMVRNQSALVSQEVNYEVDARLYTSTGKVPKELRSHVREWFPLYQRQTVASVSAASAQQPYEGTNNGTPTGCLKDLPPYPPSMLAEAAVNYAPNQLRSAYGVSELPKSAKVGKATRLAIISEGGDGFSPQAAKIAAECFNRTPIKYRPQPVKGLVGTLPDTQGEADLDVQVSQYVLPPGAKVDVVQALPTAKLNFPSFATAFNLDRRPEVMTLSYSQCEIGLKREYKRIPWAKPDQSVQESLFIRMGLAGMTFFAATGDSGSSGCVNQDNGQGPRKANTTYPGSSQYVTAVGGSMIQLDGSNQRTDEFVWNNTQLTIEGLDASAPVGGNGGTSMLYERPWWQPKSMTKSDMRTTPDLVAHAGLPAWPMFVVGSDEANPTQGTSAATPFSASSFAIINATERLAGRPPVGLVQPLLYDLMDDGFAFYDITEYNNDVYSVGCCSAKVGYDKASGLGAPRFDLIAKAVAEHG